MPWRGRGARASRPGGSGSGSSLLFHVLSGAADELVPAAAALELIGALAAEQLVTTAAPEEGVLAGVAGERVAAGLAQQEIGAATALHVVGALAAEEHVGAGAAEHLVLAALAADQVVAAEAENRVVASVPGDHVTLRGAADHVRPRGPLLRHHGRVASRGRWWRRWDLELEGAHVGRVPGPRGRVRHVGEVDRARHAPLIDARVRRRRGGSRQPHRREPTAPTLVECRARLRDRLSRRRTPVHRQRTELGVLAEDVGAVERRGHRLRVRLDQAEVGEDIRRLISIGVVRREPDQVVADDRAVEGRLGRGAAGTVLTLAGEDATARRRGGVAGDRRALDDDSEVGRRYRSVALWVARGTWEAIGLGLGVQPAAGGPGLIAGDRRIPDLDRRACKLAP